MPGLCDALELPWEPSVLRGIAPAQHCLGGNSRVNQRFRETSVYRFEPPQAISLESDLVGVVEQHRARDVHRRLQDAADRCLS